MQTQASTSSKGREGEAMAREYLIEHHFEILACNWRFHHLEIDIIALKNGVIHIIEVKTRKQGALLKGEASVTITKQKHLIHAANAFARRYKRTEELSMDVIAIDFRMDGSIELRHLQDAFYPF